MRFCQTSGSVTLHRNYGFFLTLHTGVFNEISPIAVSLHTINYRTDIISFSLGVVKQEILDEISKMLYLISYEI